MFIATFTLQNARPRRDIEPPAILRANSLNEKITELTAMEMSGADLDRLAGVRYALSAFFNPGHITALRWPV